MGVCGSHPQTHDRQKSLDIKPASRTHTHGSTTPDLTTSHPPINGTPMSPSLCPSSISPINPPINGSGHFPSIIRKDRQPTQAVQNAQITKLMHESAQFHRSQGGTSLHFTRLDLKNLTDIYLQLRGESDEITKELFTSQIRNMAEKSNKLSRRTSAGSVLDEKPGEDQYDGMGHHHTEHIENRTTVATSGPLKGVSLIDIDLIFDAFDYDHSGSINFKEMISGFSFICRGSEYEKFRFLFRIFDRDNNGELSRSEFFAMLKHVSASVLKMEQQCGNISTYNMSPLQAYVAMNGGRTKRAASFLGMPPPPMTPEQQQQQQRQQQQLSQHQEESKSKIPCDEEDEFEHSSIHIHPQLSQLSRKSSLSSANSRAASRGTSRGNSNDPSPKSSPSPRTTMLSNKSISNPPTYRRAPGSLKSLVEEKAKTDHVDVANIVNADEDEILEQVTSAFEAADADCDGRISLEEFEQWVVGDAMARRFMESLRQSCTRICGISSSHAPANSIPSNHRKRISQDIDYDDIDYGYDDEGMPPVEVDLDAIDVADL